jgi:hypothetical protein
VLPVTVELDSVVEGGRANAATVNDVLLTAIVGALMELLADRGEVVRELVVSVPFAVRGGDALGNHSAVLPIRVPALADPVERLRAVVRATHEAKQSERGASNALLGPVFRVLAHIGLFHRFIDHQRMIHTFVTDLRGPADPLILGGHRIASIVPMSVTTGNVTVAFAILSYAGALTVAIVADPDRTPDAGRLQALLKAQLLASDRVVRSKRDGSAGPAPVDHAADPGSAAEGRDVRGSSTAGSQDTMPSSASTRASSPTPAAK